MSLRLPLAISLIAFTAPLLAGMPGSEGAPPQPAADSAPTSPTTVAQIVSLTVYPPAVALTNGSEKERFIVSALFDDGITRDVTADCQVKLAAEGLVKVDEKFQLHPLADGETVLEASFGGQTASMKVAVAKAAEIPKKSFKLDIQPVLMRAGCNAGSCHGSASGKNGFKLSLFGFDPEMDYVTLTRETGARRLTTADSEVSLILQKATTGVAHEGGERFQPGTPLYETMNQWIQEGANRDPDGLPTLTGVEIMPKQVVLYGTRGEKQGMNHRVTVRATYSDGSDRDVTELAILASMNETSAQISPDGTISGRERGEASIIARFGTYAVVTQAIVIPPDEPYEWDQSVKDNNYIDTLTHKKHRQLRILPSDVCDDTAFVRRVYLDIVGVLPTAAESSEFLASTEPDKRAKLIDHLLTRPEFPELWAMKWAELLRIESSSQRISYKAMYSYTTWLRDQIVAGVPLNEMVKSLLTASGGNFSTPAANFYMVETDPKLMAENVAQVFTGIRIQCAQCHNHPFERWTMDDYYSFSAFFAQIGRKPAEDPREIVVFNSGGGEVGHLKDGRAMPPKVLGVDAPNDLKGRDRREVLAEWMVSPDNPWFAKVFANRVWAHFMGKGIVDPPDDVRVSNPPVNPELFDELGRKFIESGYDLRAIVRDICNSRTYQLSTHSNATNETDLTNFSHRIPRRLPAEQLLDVICQVTESPEKFRGLPTGARATQVADGNTGNYFLSIFGRPARTSACTCDRRGEPTLSQALHLINGDTIAGRAKSDRGRLLRLINEQKATPDITREIYLAAYSRPPTDEELARAEKYVSESADPKQGYEDLFWAVLNSKEFVFQH